MASAKAEPPTTAMRRLILLDPPRSSSILLDPPRSSSFLLDPPESARQRKLPVGIGRLFEPVMLLFISVSAVGISWIISKPEMLWALDDFAVPA